MQFPLSDLLTGARRIFTSIMAKKDDGNYQEMNIDSNGGIKTAVVTELPPGTNNIGIVDVNVMPEVGIKNNAASDPIKVVPSANATLAITFQPNSPAIGTGNVLTVNGYKTLTVSTSGTSTSQTLAFEGAGTDGNFTSIQGINLSTGTTSAQTTQIGELWRFDITGLVSFRVNLTAVSGGSVTVLGVAVV